MSLNVDDIKDSCLHTMRTNLLKRQAFDYRRSIYIGEGDSSHNAVVNTGKVELTTDEIKSLYKSLGLTISIPAAQKVPFLPDETAAPITPIVQDASTNIPTRKSPPKLKNLPGNANFVEPNNNPPGISYLTAIESTQDTYNRGKSKVKDLKSGNSYDYDNNGYVVVTYDKDDNVTRWINCKDDETVNWYIDYEYNKGGVPLREIHRNADGSVVFDTTMNMIKKAISPDLLNAKLMEL